MVAALATWRLTAFLYFDYGPFGQMRKIRERASGIIGKQFECFWCLSLWAALVVTPFMLWFWWPLIPLALSGATLLLSQSGRIIWKEMVSDE